ncbi:MAG TPA: NusG domain II-containing protein [Clostridiales bacterium]|nr:NusG domain II-containing protein [Clostridiales bacterium]
MFKKADIILAVTLLVLGFGVLAVLKGLSVPGNSVAVTVDGVPFGVYDLSKDQIVHIDSANGHNTMQILDGQARMTEADCPNGDCLTFGSISQTSQMIVCLPNHVVITVLGESGPDAIAY